MQRTSAPSKFNMEGIPTAFRAAIVVGAKASQAGPRGAHDPSVAEMERKLGIDPGHDAQAMARTDVAHLLEVGDQVRRRGTSAGGVATGADAAQQQRLRGGVGGGSSGGGSVAGIGSAAGSGGGSAAGSGAVRISHPQARARFAEIAQKVESLINAPVQPRPVYVYGTPPESRENADAFRFALYVMPAGGRRGQPMDQNCEALLKFTNRNCASIRDLLYVQDITTLPKVPSWLNQVPALLDRSTRNVYFGANAKSFVDEAIARENATTRAYVSQAMRERDQLVRTYQAEADQIVARYAEPAGSAGAGAAGGAAVRAELPGDDDGGDAYMMPPDAEELAHVFDEDAPNMLDPEQMMRIPEIQSKLTRGGPGQQYDASAHIAARGGPGGGGGGAGGPGVGRRGGGGGPPSQSGGGQFISGLDVSGLNLNFRK